MNALLALAAQLERSHRATKPTVAPKDRSSTEQIRQILADDPDDARLSAGLRASRLLGAGVTCRTIKFVSVAPTGLHPPMRIDLTVDASGCDGTGIWRASHVLLVSSGKPGQRLARAIRKALQELTPAKSAPQPAERQLVLDVDLRLVPAPRLPNVQPYHLLSTPHELGSDAVCELSITTWDAFLGDSSV